MIISIIKRNFGDKILGFLITLRNCSVFKTKLLVSVLNRCKIIFQHVYVYVYVYVSIPIVFVFVFYWLSCGCRQLSSNIVLGGQLSQMTLFNIALYSSKCESIVLVVVVQTQLSLICWLFGLVWLNCGFDNIMEAQGQLGLILCRFHLFDLFRDKSTISIFLSWLKYEWATWLLAAMLSPVSAV